MTLTAAIRISLGFFFEFFCWSLKGYARFRTAPPLPYLPRPPPLPDSNNVHKDTNATGKTLTQRSLFPWNVQIDQEMAREMSAEEKRELIRKLQIELGERPEQVINAPSPISQPRAAPGCTPESPGHAQRG